MNSRRGFLKRLFGAAAIAAGPAAFAKECLSTDGVGITADEFKKKVDHFINEELPYRDYCNTWSVESESQISAF